MKVTVTLEINLDVDGWAAEFGHGKSAIGLTEAMREGLRALGNVDTWQSAIIESAVLPEQVEIKTAKATGHF